MPARSGNKHAFIAAYRKTGEIAKAAKTARVQRGMHYRWIKRDPAYKAAFEAACVEIASKRADQAHQALAVGIEEELRAEIGNLHQRITDLSRDLRRAIRDLGAKLSTAAPRTRKRQEPTEGDALLDQIARGMAKKPFSKLTAGHQDTVRDIAARLKQTPD